MRKYPKPGPSLWTVYCPRCEKLVCLTSPPRLNTPTEDVMKAPLWKCECGWDSTKEN